MSSWRPILRLARRDTRRHLLRTILAAILIALPVAALVTYTSSSNPGLPSRDRVLASIPDGAEAIITATAIPQGGAPFPQVPEGAPGPWMDHPDTVPVDTATITSKLGTGTQLAEYWVSPTLMASSDLDLQPGERRESAAGAARLDGAPLDRVTTVQLNEAQADALALLAPEPVEGRLPENPDEILVSQALAQRLGLKVGDTVGVVAPPDSGIRGTEGTTIAAMQDSANGYLVAGIADSAQYRAWAPQGWLSELVAAHPQGTQRHWLALNAPVTWDQAKQLNQLQAFAVSRHVLTNYPSADQLYPTAPIDTNALLEAAFGVILMGILGGFLVLFLVTPALAISAEQSRRTLGLAGAAGATPHDMGRMVRAQGLFSAPLAGSWGAYSA